ncbi:hypothetical protein [Natronococcus occultus]|uniref:Uncharacterized protein n=1 Tax=Natronococcus occultus SP4 TaxID=694430 RepID=L0JTR6_9EURY|nr:hypothetical protein [Natronococcus occultus]AGB36377.1 hypothetical protein Natoc_0515 [Natronococcus occultus SP4]
MPNEVFTTPDEPTGEWADVRMTDPAAGEWDVDVIVAGGQVEYVDLRVKPELLAGFVDCLVDDVTDEEAQSILRTVADRRGLELVDDPDV